MATERMRTKGIIVQIATWLVIFLMPAMFADPGETMTLGRYLVKSTATLCMFVAFYATYLWLMPAYLRGKHAQYWLGSIVLVLTLAFGHHRFMTYLWHKDHHASFEEREKEKKKRDWLIKTNRRGKKTEQKTQKKENSKMPPGPLFSFDVLIVSRELFQYAVVVGVASSIVLSLRWSEAEKARREAENARTKAELANLRSQVNPHFLLNTLNGIYALTAFEPQKAQEAILELSKMMRHILYDNQQPFVNLTDETQFLQNYINLMRMRTGSHVSITTDFDLPPNCTVQIAPMILISLVENAFKHGISPTEKSFIRIKIKADRKQIVCLVENSNHPKTSQDRSGHGIGLQQVARRLELSYKGHYDWRHGVDKNNTYTSQITIQL